MTWQHPIRIVGVGSPVGDDALAWEAMRSLRESHVLRPEIEVYMVEGGQRILDVLDGRGTLVLVDAIVAGTTPGTIHRFAWPDDRIEGLRPGSTHDLQPAEALRLASALGIAPPQIVVFAMEVEQIDPFSGLSTAVRDALPQLVRCLVEELEASARIQEKSPEPITEEH
jgi:hydrogenase maturation protease